MLASDSSYLHVKTLTDATEEAATHNSLHRDAPNTASDEQQLFDSPFDNLPGFTKPSDVAVIENDKILSIILKEGFEISLEQVQALNFFNSPIGAFQYALYYFGVPDFYIVLMVNKKKRAVYGYHVIDFTDKYSLSDDLSNRMKTPAMIF